MTSFEILLKLAWILTLTIKVYFRGIYEDHRSIVGLYTANMHQQANV